MQNYKHGGHTIWDCKYHLVWVTKYRYTVLGGAEVSRVIARDFSEQRDDYLCEFYQQRSCAYADRDTAELIGIEGGAVSEGEEF
jgi:hypothetical protein